MNLLANYSEDLFMGLLLDLYNSGRVGSTGGRLKLAGPNFKPNMVSVP